MLKPWWIVMGKYQRNGVRKASGKDSMRHPYFNKIYSAVSHEERKNALSYMWHWQREKVENSSWNTFNCSVIISELFWKSLLCYITLFKFFTSWFLCEIDFDLRTIFGLCFNFWLSLEKDLRHDEPAAGANISAVDWILWHTNCGCALQNVRLSHHW